MANLLTSAVLLVALVSTVSSLKCYKCRPTRENAACEAVPFVPTATGIEVVECATSCLTNKADFDGWVRVERLCADQKPDNNTCTTLTPFHKPGTPIRFEVTSCACDTDNCNIVDPVAPVVPTSAPHPVKCYGCGHQEAGNGTCEKEPFDVNAAGVQILDCLTSCAITKTVEPAQGGQPARTHVTRECTRDYAAVDKCHQWTSQLDSEKPLLVQWCTCNTDRCNAEASIVQPNDASARPVLAGAVFLMAVLVRL